jgi:phosphatidylglycerol:prolipoprotein diacylglycerol transferase
MFPELFSIGDFAIHTYGLLVAIGFSAGLLITVRLGKSLGFSAQQVLDMGFIIGLWAIVGSRVMYVLMNFSYYRNDPAGIFKIWQGGLVFSGGLIAVVLSMGWYLKRHHLSIWKFGDLWAPGVAIGQAIGRIGCFMAGCCYGKQTTLPWAVVFTHPRSLAPSNVSLHPTQLYASLSGLVIFAVLMVLYAKRKFEGQVFLWFLILHSTARLLIERFRGDDRGLIPGSEMSVTQLVTLLVLVASVTALFILKSRKEKKASPSAPKTSD